MAGQQNDIGSKCAKCGACAPACPVYLSTGRESHTARGKLHLFSHDASFSSAYFNDLLAKCIQCGACDDACPRRLEPSSAIRSWRGPQPFAADPHAFRKLLTRKGLASPLLQQGAGLALRLLLRSLPKESGLQHSLDLLLPGLAKRPVLPSPRPRKNAAPLSYFPGCLAGHLYTDIKAATAHLALRCGHALQTPTSLTCCGLAAHSSGNKEEARQLARQNIRAFDSDRAPTGPILTSCASCTSHLKSYPALFSHDPSMLAKAQAFAHRIREFSTFFVGRLGPGPRPQEKIFYHDPCHLRFGPCRVKEEPRRLLTEVNGCPPLALPPQCCGHGGLFRLSNPNLSQKIFHTAHAPLTELSEGQVVTTCSGCLLQWQQGLAKTESPLTAEHLAVFLAKMARD